MATRVGTLLPIKYDRTGGVTQLMTKGHVRDPLTRCGFIGRHALDRQKMPLVVYLDGDDYRIMNNGFKTRNREMENWAIIKKKLCN